MVLPHKKRYKRRRKSISYTIFSIILLTFATICLLRQSRSKSIATEEEVSLVALDMRLSGDSTPTRVRLKLYEKEAPGAARFVRQAIEYGCKDKCTIYRGEPVPDYWGSEEKPDRFFDGGRWGPPYALIQGQIVVGQKNAIDIAKPEPHRPIIERGMVAWAGGKGGPHFFVALANHPEWEHGHTVFAEVLPKDMGKLDDLVKTRPLVETKPKRPPIVTNFVEPIRFTIQEIKS